MKIKLDNNTKVNTLLFAFTCIAVLPFILISFYIHPHYDDYDFLNKLSGKNIFECTLYWYNTWSGRFSSIFISNILTYGTENIFIYRLYPILLMILYVASFYTLFKTLFGNFFSKSRLFFLALFFLVLYIYRIPEVTTGFYYMICSYISSIGTIALIFLLSVLLKLLGTEERNNFGLVCSGCLLALFIGGSYEPTMTMSLMFVFLVGLVLFKKKNPNLRWVILIGLVLLTSTVIAIIAPGNKVRGGEDILQAEHVSILAVVLKLIVYSVNIVVNTIQNPLLILSLILFIPIAIELNKKNHVVRTVLDIHPLLPFLGLFLMSGCAFFPSAWVQNAPARVSNQVYLFLIINLFFCVQVIINYFLKRGIELNVSKSYRFFFKVIIVICLIPSLNNKTIARAYSDLLNKAPSYSRKVEERYAFIRMEKETGRKEVLISPLFNDAKSYPLTIYYNYQELSKDPDAAVNRLYAKYWGVDSVKTDNDKIIEFINITRAN
jgi:hypothetical protein